jgi:hypothetical protein
MELKFVAPIYDVAEKHLKYTKTLDGNRRLDVIAQPINPCVTDIPGDIEQAFGSVILCVPDLREEDPALIGLLDRLKHELDSEDAQREVLHAVAGRIIHMFPQMKEEPRTAYICPVVSKKGEGYRLGYVVAWEEADALDVAEFMAGGRADIYVELLDFNGEYLRGYFLGDISYSDVLCETDSYRRIVEGEELRNAVAEQLGIEAPEPQDPEFPGMELLETFTKLD